MTLPWVAVAHLRMMSWPERLSWVVWILVVTQLVSVWGRWSRSRTVLFVQGEV